MRRLARRSRAVRLDSLQKLSGSSGPICTRTNAAAAAAAKTDRQTGHTQTRTRKDTRGQVSMKLRGGGSAWVAQVGVRHRSGGRAGGMQRLAEGWGLECWGAGRREDRKRRERVGEVAGKSERLHV